MSTISEKLRSLDIVQETSKNDYIKTFNREKVVELTRYYTSLDSERIKSVISNALQRGCNKHDITDAFVICAVQCPEKRDDLKKLIRIHNEIWPSQYRTNKTFGEHVLEVGLSVLSQIGSLEGYKRVIKYSLSSHIKISRNCLEKIYDIATDNFGANEAERILGLEGNLSSIRKFYFSLFSRYLPNSHSEDFNERNIESEVLIHSYQIQRLMKIVPLSEESEILARKIKIYNSFSIKDNEYSFYSGMIYLRDLYKTVKLNCENDELSKALEFAACYENDFEEALKNQINHKLFLKSVDLEAHSLGVVLYKINNIDILALCDRNYSFREDDLTIEYFIVDREKLVENNFISFLESLKGVKCCEINSITEKKVYRESMEKIIKLCTPYHITHSSRKIVDDLNSFKKPKLQKVGNCALTSQKAVCKAALALQFYEKYHLEKSLVEIEVIIENEYKRKISMPLRWKYYEYIDKYKLNLCVNIVSKVREKLFHNQNKLAAL